MEHHVYFWLKEEYQSEEQRAAFEKGMDDLLKVETIARAIWSVPAATPERPVTDHSWDYALSISFDTIEDHNIYQDHPLHDVFIADFKDLWTKVEVKDLA